MSEGVFALVRASLRGAVDVAGSEGGLTPLRLPMSARAQFDGDWMKFTCEQPSGVRLAFDTAATWIELTVMTTALCGPWTLGEVPPAVFSATVNGHHACDVRTEGGSRLHVEASGELRLEPGDPVIARFDIGGTGTQARRVELWLPQTVPVEIRDVTADATLDAADSSGALRWWHHGSSISHCVEAETPLGVWPVAAADTLGLDITNLGFAGNAQLDPFTARALRDSGADLFSLKIGINIVGGDTMKRRTFIPAVHGFIDTIRETAPSAPILIISPIVCPMHEDVPGPTVTDPVTGERRGTPVTAPDMFVEPLTLRSVREILQEIVKVRAVEDSAIWYMDGLELFGPDDLDELPDGLHPSAAGYLRIAERFAQSSVVSSWAAAARGLAVMTKGIPQ